MIRKLLLCIALLSCIGISHAQNSSAPVINPINVSNSDKSVDKFCVSADAVAYSTADGLFYYNYSRTIKISNKNPYIVQITGKTVLWIEPDNANVITLYQFDGTSTSRLEWNYAVKATEVKISSDYFLYIAKVGVIDQVFRYNRTTGVSTQVTNETGNCSDVLIADSRTSSFSFTYAIPNTAKAGYYNLISRTPGSTRRLVYDEYRAGHGCVAGGYIFFDKNDISTGHYQLFRCNVNSTGASQITWYSGDINILGGSDKYLSYFFYGGGPENIMEVIDPANLQILYSTSHYSWSFNVAFSQDKFVWTEYDGNDYEVMCLTGRTVMNVSDNYTEDRDVNVTPSGDIVWLNSYSGSSGRFMIYNPTTASISPIDFQGGLSDFKLERGNILAKLLSNSVSQCFLYTPSSYKLSSLDFRCDETSKNGASVLSIEKPLKQGVIGLDFKVTFDPAAVSVGSVDVLNPTDANGNTAAVAYTVSGNTISISYYLRSVPGSSSIIAKGPILAINLVRNAATTYTSNYSLLKVTDAEESYAIGTVKVPVPVSAAYNISTETYVGQLLYGGIAGRPMAHSTANPAAVYQTDYACVQQPLTSAVVNPGTTGVFRINKNVVNSNLQFVKDLPGSYDVACTSSNIMTFMNGSDWAMAADISRGNVSAVTSALQYIAADVNMDGVVSAGDASLISSRSVLKICEYPQKWNYILQNGLPVPGPGYKPSKDFVFVYGNIPLDSASRNAVPKVADCLPMPSFQYCPASDALATKYSGVLLGDVNLSYWPSNVLTRIGAVNDVVFSSDEDTDVIKVSGTCAERLKALDFRIVMPEGVKVEDVVPAHPDVNVNWNTVDSLLLVTSYVDGDSSAPDKLFNIILKNGLLNNLSTGDFYINGEPAGFSNRIVNGTTDLIRRQVKISPNPTAGRFMLEFRESRTGWITVSDMEGKVICRTFADGNSGELNIEDAPAGVYFVKVESDNTTEVYKVVKQ
jgi:hypothetical protein